MPKIVGTEWFNTRPLGPNDLEGKVVLADFWTYSCINCLRTLPYLREWWSRYEDKDLVLIGIHAPEFGFEKETVNVSRAIEELGVTWPVVLDNDYVNWHNFANHYWPAKYMSDRDGRIVYEHFGEGDYEKTERKIQELLKMNRHIGPLPEPMKDSRLSCVRPTPELYCHYTRGLLGNPGGYVYEKEADYVGPTRLRDDTIALEGKFIATREYVESREPGSTVLLSFKGTAVNMVLRSQGGEAQLRVLLDGRLPEQSIAGTDMDRNGEVRLDEPRMYNLLKADRPLNGVVAVQAREGTYQAFAFTFSGCAEMT